MIDKYDGLYFLVCDICGDAVDYKKENGWKSQKHKGEWE